MKKSKMFMAAGAFALAITAVFATKANKKFVPISTGYYFVSGSKAMAVHFPSAVLTVTKSSFAPAFVTITTAANPSTIILRTQLKNAAGTLLYID
jgi:hypothetical protein